ncbi:MAG: phospho-N-acetylmuramoyl-pentapeptide-transferase [Candidatus Dormiibacterota bacterium]
MRETIIVGVLAFVAGVLLYPAYIGLLVRFGARQHVASYSPASHRAKEGTPTLGGALFCFIALIGWLAVDRSREGFVAIFALLAGAIAGGLDDIVNIRDVTRMGLSVWQKLSLQGVTGVLVGIGLTIAGFTHQFFPGLGAPNLGWGLAVVVAMAVVATSNAVNLTDGVDGLAASCTALVFIGIAIIAVTRDDLAVAFLAAALAGAVVAFLIFNWFPARVFMGDAGSLALGCAIVALTTELHLLWLLPVLGIVFVVEAASVVVNVTAIRRFGTRVLRASPIHHHFEELGLRERRLVAAFAAAAAAGTAITVLFAHVAGPVS